MKFTPPSGHNRPLFPLPSKITAELATQSALQELARSMAELARIARSVATDRGKEAAQPAGQGSLANAFRQAGGTGSVSALLAAFEGDVTAARKHLDSVRQQAEQDCLNGGALTFEEACQYLRMGETRLRGLVKRGRIKTVVEDRRIRFRRAELDRYLRDNER